MKTLMSSLLVTLSFNCFSQGVKVVYSNPQPLLLTLLSPFRESEDTLLISSTNPITFTYTYTVTAENQVRLAFDGMDRQDLGNYRVSVGSKNSSITRRQFFDLRICTQAPVVTGVKKVGDFQENTPISWNSIEDEIVLEISGQNFDFELGKIPLFFEDGSNITLEEVTFNNTIITATINVRNFRSGKVKYRVINFDGEEESRELVLNAANRPLFDSLRPITLSNGVATDVTLRCDFPYQILSIEFVNIKTNVVTPDISVQINKKRIDPTVPELSLHITPSISKYIPTDYNVYVRTYDEDYFPLSTNPFRIKDNGPVFSVEAYPYEFWPEDGIPISKASTIFQNNDTVLLTSGRNIIRCIYVEETVGNSVKCFLKSPQKMPFSSVSSGIYTVTNNQVTLKGQIKIFDWPEINTLSWHPKNESSSMFFNGNLYATKQSQPYRVYLTLKKNVELEASKWKFFGVSPISAGRDGDKIFYDIIIPNTIQADAQPKIEYQSQDGSFHDVNVQGNLENIREFSAPANEEEFITLTFGDPSKTTSFGFNKIYENSLYPVLLESETDYLTILVDNKAIYNKGGQAFVLTLNYGKHSQKTDTLRFVSGERRSERLGLKNPIHPWDTVSIEIEFIGREYSPVINQGLKKKKTISTYKKNRMSFGLGVPVTATIVRDFRTKNWIYSPLAFQGSITFNRYNAQTRAWKNLSPGFSFGFSSLSGLVDDNSKYFAMIYCGYLELDPFYRTDLRNVKLPIHLGVGGLSYWKEGVSYLNLVLQFSVVVNVTP